MRAFLNLTQGRLNDFVLNDWSNNARLGKGGFDTYL